MASTTDSDSTLHHSSQDGLAVDASWWLTIVHHRRHELVGRSLRLPPSEPVELGRKYAGFGDGALDDHRISRRHAQVRVRRDGPLELGDLGSQNGSFVNGSRVHEPALLARGDIVRLGSSLLLVSYGDNGPRPFSRGAFVGMSPALATIEVRLPELAADRAALVICGETGTGKAELTRLVHEASGRAGALVRVSCAAIPDRLVAHELFGYEQGAFPGADSAREGLIASAAGGTIVFEELGDASASLQGALLRFVDTGEIRRLGSDQPVSVDARIIVTTGERFASQSIRADLHARLTNNVIELPPLRERIEDAAIIAAQRVRDLTGGAGCLHWRTALALLRAEWSGNVRQLLQIVERLVQDAAGETPIRLSPTVEAQLRAPSLDTPTHTPPPNPNDIELPTRRLSKSKLRDLLREHAGNVTAIAAHLGIGRNTLYRWLKAANLNIEDFRR